MKQVLVSFNGGKTWENVEKYFLGTERRYLSSGDAISCMIGLAHDSPKYKFRVV
jgi:hypothetical protein